MTTAFGTVVDRHLGDILAGAPCWLSSDVPSILAGQYRVVLLVTLHTRR